MFQCFYSRVIANVRTHGYHRQFSEDGDEVEVSWKTSEATSTVPQYYVQRPIRKLEQDIEWASQDLSICIERLKQSALDFIPVELLGDRRTQYIYLYILSPLCLTSLELRLPWRAVLSQK